MNDGISEDLFSLDISRFEKFHSETKFITERVTETLGNLYAMHWPYKQLITSRNQKILPYHENLKKKGACFGQAAAFERPMWYALNGNKPEYEYSFGYQNWYESAKHETRLHFLHYNIYVQIILKISLVLQHILKCLMNKVALKRI